MSNRRRFTNSELRAWKRCRRKWWLRYYRNLAKRRESPVSAAGLGTLVHLGLQEVYRQTGDDEHDPLGVMRARIEKDKAKAIDAAAEGLISVSEAEEECKSIDKQAELALIMVEGYLEWLEDEGPDFGLTFVGAEQSIEVPLDEYDPRLEGTSLLAKLDARVLRDFDGAVLFMDHKTVQNIADKTGWRAYTDEQFLHYHLIDYLAHLQGLIDAPKVDGALVNMLRKVKRTARATPPFYAREDVRHNVEYLRSYWVRVMAEIAEVRDAEARLDAGEDHRSVVYPNPTRDCDWDCPFKGVCPSFDDGGDPESVLRFGFIEIDPLARYAEDIEADKA